MPPFEAAVLELEQIVAQLEHGELPLEAALTHYERGARLVRHCQQTLDVADQRIRVLEGEALVPYVPEDRVAGADNTGSGDAVR